MFATIDELPADRRVLVRVDLNAPVDDGVVQDNRRFARHAETIRELAEAGHPVVLLAHQGRPGRETFLPLDQHAAILESHIDRPVEYLSDTYGDRVEQRVESLGAGSILLLENVRMVEDELAAVDPEVHANSPMVRSLASVTDAYVNDAYSAAHRGHASLVGFPMVMDSYAGRVMEAEYRANTAIRERSFDGPVVMILGGTKAEDLIPVIERVDARVDRFCLGGVVGELFARAAGYDVGYDVEGSELFDHQWEDHREQIEDTYKTYGDRLTLPVDLAYEDASGGRTEVDIESASKTTSFLDVGGRTADRYVEVIEPAAAVFVKGALGVFEDERFANGTVSILEAIADSSCFSVVGGGDTSRAIDLHGLSEASFSHVSIAGGAYVRALTGEELIAIDALSAAEPTGK